MNATDPLVEQLQRDCKEVRVSVEQGYSDRADLGTGSFPPLWIISGFRNGQPLLKSEHRHWTTARKNFVDGYSKLVQSGMFKTKETA